MDEPINLKEKVRRLPDGPGVYLMKDRLGRIIYVGKARSLKKRVSSYFQRGRAQSILQPKIRALIELIVDFDVFEVRSEPEALLLEGKLIKQWKPRYNTDFTDDKRFLLVRVDLGEDDAEVPADPDPQGRPFALLRPVRPQRPPPEDPGADAPPVWDPARRCQPGPAAGWNLAALRRRPAGVVWVFQYGDAGGIPAPGGGRLRLSRGEVAGMAGAAPRRDGRRCGEAGLREGRRPARCRLRPRRDAGQDPAVRADRPHRGEPRRDRAADARRGARFARLAADMECFDISHISGTFVVASMVRFSEGRPDKDQYRRFQIKSFIGNDDFRAMEEVVGRRYRRLTARAGRSPIWS